MTISLRTASIIIVTMVALLVASPVAFAGAVWGIHSAATMAVGMGLGFGFGWAYWYLCGQS